MNDKSEKAIKIFLVLIVTYVTICFSAIFCYSESYHGIKDVNKSVPHFFSYEAPDQQEAFWLIVAMASDNGFDTTTALRIAECESQFQYNAVNASPSSTATGLYQWTQTTWDYIGSPGDRLNPQDNILAFFNYYPLYPQWWVCK